MSESQAALAAELRGAVADLGLALSEQQLDALMAYLALLERWNRVYNLTAVREPSAMLRQHLVDCLAVVPPMRRHLMSHAGGGARARVLDVGSGGGLPGVVLAIACPELQVTCVDTVAKKAGFVRQVAAELGLANLLAVHARVESLPPVPPFDLITSRAFSSLADLAVLTRHLMGRGGAWMAMKGQVPGDEIAALPADIRVFHVEPLAVPGLEARRCLVWMALEASE